MSKPKVLIVDDEVNLTKMLKLNLDETGKYEVMTLNDSTLAIKTIHEFKPDLVMLDVMMPNIQGNEIAELISEDKAIKDTKVIFLTALVKKSEVPEEDKTIGGRKFIAKPVKVDELIRVLEEELAN